MVRLGSIQKFNGRVGKVVKKVIRFDVGRGFTYLDQHVKRRELCILKLHYNGSYILAPTEFFETPTKEERRLDKRNAPYWRNADQLLKGNIPYTAVPMQWFDIYGI